MNGNNSFEAIATAPAAAEAAVREPHEQQQPARVWPGRGALGRWSAILLLAAGLNLLAVAPLQAATPKREIPDNNITAAVEEGLLFEKGVFPDDVEVSTSQGIVTLSGSVADLLAKERAVKIAESFRGVRGVIDRIEVLPVSRPDQDIHNDIMMALLQDPATESYHVTTSVRDAVATLTGSVGSYAEKQLATRIAKGVKGLKEVRNDITLNFVSIRTDPQIDADVKARLQWDIWINGDLLNVAVKDGKVMLTGVTRSAIGKSRAFDDAWVNGVTAVEVGGISVDPWGSNGARRKLQFAIRSDREIKQAVQASLRLDPRLSAFAIDVTVEDGIARLNGTVGSLKAKTSGGQDAQNVAGVWVVNNFLKVRPTGRFSDAEIVKQLKAALLWDPLLDNATITVAVRNNVASLSGTVDSRLQRDEAQDVAARTKGVWWVRNQLKVEPQAPVSYYDWPYYYSYDRPYRNQAPDYGPETFDLQPYLSDAQIKKNIEDAFFWSPFVDGDDIKVTVDKGVATLTGTVGTWIGWYEADKDAYKSGATRVLDLVQVKKGVWWWPW